MTDLPENAGKHAAPLPMSKHLDHMVEMAMEAWDAHEGWRLGDHVRSFRRDDFCLAVRERLAQAAQAIEFERPAP